MLAILLRDQRGASAIEYGLIVSLIAVALASSFLSLGNGVSDQFETIDTEYTAANN